MSDTDAANITNAEYPAASFVVTKLTEADFNSGPCSWKWFYRILDGAGNDRGEESVQTATRGIADELIKPKIPAGGSANFLRGPIK
jgi:hypothetical protein